MNSPRWLGWILLIAGVVNALGWGFAIVVIALFADVPWGEVAEVAAEMLMLCVLGVLAAVAGIRILRGTSRQGTAIAG